MISVYVNAF
jgi:pentatricopeptide repeat protein